MSDPLPGPHALWYPRKNDWLLRDSQTPTWGFCPYFAGLVPYWVSVIRCTGFKPWNVARMGFLRRSDARAHSAEVWVTVLSVQFMLYLRPRGKHQKSLLPQSGYWFPGTLQEYSIFVVSLLLLSLVEKLAMFKCQHWQRHRWMQRCYGLISSVSSESSLQRSGRCWSQSVKLPPHCSSCRQPAPASPLRACFMPTPLSPILTFKLPDICCALCWSWKKHRRKIATASHWCTVFLGSAGSSWFIQQARTGWALSHDPGACSCCCSSVLLRRV